MNRSQDFPSELVIEPGRAERQYWRDFWRYRELLYFLTWRNILVRYKQTVIGVAWGLARPILTLAIFTFVFGRLAKFPSGGSPYPLLVFCGMLPWQFFATALTESSNSLISNSSMISKVYFPRMVVPASSVITSLVDFLFSFGLMSVLLVWYQVLPGPGVFLLPLFLALAFAAAFGVGLWISALMVRYRDFRIIVPFMVQIGFYVSPIGYLSSVVPDHLRLVYSLNPMVGVIDGIRWAVLGGQHAVYMPGLLLSVATILLVLFSGVLYFRKMERTFADEI